MYSPMEVMEIKYLIKALVLVEKMQSLTKF